MDGGRRVRFFGFLTRQLHGDLVAEQAALYGTNAPPEWPTGGLTAAAYPDPASGADALAAQDAAMSQLEANGVTPTGILAALEKRHLGRLQGP